MNTLPDLLRKLRGKESLRDVSKRAGISHNYLSQLEKGVDPRTGKQIRPTPETLKRLADAYNYDYKEIMKIAGYIDEEENGNQNTELPELTPKDEREIARDLERILHSLDHADGLASYDGSTINDIDDEDKELLRSSLETSLKIAKRIAKKKYTPKKYRKNEE